ncbi:MAG: hypothetical protein LBE74_04135 [Treponema sp.]|jgi:hypothetical protein|nr:hypothetical protein [Treponema sp.]
MDDYMIKAKFEIFIKCPHCESIILKESFEYNVIGGGVFSNVNLLSFLRRKKEYFALHNIVQQVDNNTYFEKKYKCKECNKEINTTYEKRENIFNLFYLSSYCDFCHKDLGKDIYKNIDTDEIFDLDDFTERHNIYSSENNYNKTICLQCFENEDMERENTKSKTSRFKNETNIQKNNDFGEYSDLNTGETDDFYLSEDEDEWNDPNSYANCSDWEDYPENCYHCADDECPMNKE